jgi:hypothetical protein
MEKLWRMRVEIEVEPGDLDVDPGYEKGFMNVITWATSAESAKVKLANYLRTFKWQLLGVEHSAEVDDGEVSDSEVNELIDRAKEDPAAIILGTFHSYLSPKVC